MTYDWEGQRARRIQFARLLAAVSIGVAVPLIVMAWTYVT